FQFLLPAFFISKASGQQPTMGKVAAHCRDTTKTRITDIPRTLGVAVPGIRIFGDTIKIETPVTYMIKGRVTDEKDNAVPFASIQAGRTANIVFANDKGEFDIHMTDILPLMVSSAGFENKQVFIEDKKQAQIIKLSASANQGDIENS